VAVSGVCDGDAAPGIDVWPLDRAGEDVSGQPSAGGCRWGGVGFLLPERRAGIPVAWDRLGSGRRLRPCGEQRHQVVVAKGAPGPGSEEPQVGGGGEDGDHDGGFADSHDAEGAAAEGFGVVVLKVAEPSLHPPRLPSGRSSPVIEPSTKRSLGSACRATASMPGDRSTPKASSPR